MNRKMTDISLVIIFIISINVCMADTTGLAVVPSSIEIQNAYKGGEYEKTITIYNPTDTDGGFSITGEGECSDWMKFYHIDNPNTSISNITISGKGNEKILIKTLIPEDAASGEYTSQIVIQNIPMEGLSGSTMIVRTPITAKINVTGTQILTGVVKSITIRDTEINYPLTIKIEFENTGNVAAKPLINIDILKDETIIDSISYSEMQVELYKREIIPVKWDTNETEIGEYMAKVSVLLSDEILETKELPFEILPYGSLSRQGNLTCITSEDKPAIGMNKILSTFDNTGKIETRVKFIGEVFVDGTLTDAIESNERLVQPREKVNLTSYLPIDSSGSYTIKGHVEYEGKTTKTEEYSFDISEGEKSTPGFGIFSIITAFLILALTFRKRFGKS